jgi:AcrR family transcriptional regulator
MRQIEGVMLGTAATLPLCVPTSFADRRPMEGEKAVNADSTHRQPPADAGERPSVVQGTTQFAFEDPLSGLPNTARKLLLAAKRIVATDGIDALTLQTVSTAAGENKAMISYYFGNKAGLIAAVLDSVIHDEYVASRNRMKNVDTAQRRTQLVDEMRRMTSATEEFRVFFELLPYVLRDEALRRRIAVLYKWYWSMKLEWLGVGDARAALRDPDLLGLTQILSAVIDGLAVQNAIDPDLDLANSYRVFLRILEGSLAVSPDGHLRESVSTGDEAARPSTA